MDLCPCFVFLVYERMVNNGPDKTICLMGADE